MPRRSALADLTETEDSPDHSGHGYLRSPGYRSEFEAQLEFDPAAAATPLWDYQAHAVQVVLELLDPGEPQALHLATGAGKTRVANQIAARWLAENPGSSVLWVTKDWRLLGQALFDFAQRHPLRPLGRLGGAGQVLHPLDERGDALVTYTTLQTLLRRLELLHDLSPSLLVWDECHWGERGQAAGILRTCKRAGVPVLGLTATPRLDSSFNVAYSRTFLELVQAGYLARPCVETPVRTGVSWRPELRRAGDLSPRSLRDLATNPSRNRTIVEHYLQQARRFGKTIIFGCSVDHLDELARRFAARGVAARAIHSRQRHVLNREALQAFRRGSVQVLLSVEMLTHGVDVPDARTVFLARPTTSDILFAQMVGRAARRDEASGKTSFHIVEFTDNTEVHAELFETAQRYFEGAAGPGLAGRPRPEPRPTRLRRHGFDPRGAPTWIPDDPALPDVVRGLWYRQDQTFGVELELTTADGSEPPTGKAWLQVAEALRSALARALPGRVARRPLEVYQGSEGSKDPRVWNVERDASAGWEVTSRVLRNLEGFLEVERACAAIDAAAAALGLSVDHRTGLHVHLGWLGREPAEVRRAIRLTRLFEPALATMVSPSRLASFDGLRYDLSSPNDYCRPVSSVFTSSRLARARTFQDLRRLAELDEARYVTLNVKPLSHLHTVEVRLHGGTLEARKILPWISTWMQLLWAASRWRRIDRVPDRDVIAPDGDVVRLALRWLPDARQPQQRAFLERLHARRCELLGTAWVASLDLTPWLLLARQWRSPAELLGVS